MTDTLLMSIEIVVLGICVLGMIKNYVTSRQRLKILRAVRDYLIDQIKRGEEPDEDMFERLESYQTTFLRYWDFGYKRILPPDDFKKIERYIGVNKYG